MNFLFYISKNYSIPIVRPIAEYLEKSDHQFSFFLSRKVKNEFANEIPENKILNNIEDTKKTPPDFVIVPGNFVDFRIPGIKVQIFHGLGVEKTSHFKIRHFFDVYCTSGPLVTERFSQLQNKHKYFLVKETGWPKVDHIVNYPIKDLREQYKIPKDFKVILFAPTHSKKMQSAEDLLPQIPKIIGKNEIWLLKFHELMSKKINHIVENFKNMRLVESYDITPYLHLADILITDTSSVAYEFMILDKPIITYKTAARKDKGINIYQPLDLRSALDRSFQKPYEYQDNREKHIQQINPKLDGEISENLIDTLIKIRQDNEIPKKKKPFNLFRKAQILYHEKFRKGYLR